MPDHPAPVFRSPAPQDALERPVDGPVLLVAGDFLDDATPVRFEDHVVAQDVHQGGRRQQPLDQPWLSERFHAGRLPNLVVGMGRRRLPFDVGVLRRPERAEDRPVDRVGYAQQVVVEEPRRSRATPLRPGLLVPPQLVYRFLLPQQVGRPGLDHHQRDPVHE